MKVKLLKNKYDATIEQHKKDYNECQKTRKENIRNRINKKKNQKKPVLKPTRRSNRLRLRSYQNIEDRNNRFQPTTSSSSSKVSYIGQIVKINPENNKRNGNKLYYGIIENEDNDEYYIRILKYKDNNSNVSSFMNIPKKMLVSLKITKQVNGFLKMVKFLQ